MRTARALTPAATARSLTAAVFVLAVTGPAGALEVTRVVGPGEQVGPVPLFFEINEGQADARIAFLARGRGQTLFLSPGGATLTLEARSSGARETVGLRLLGARKEAEVTGREELPGRSHYYIGQDRSRWRTGIRQFAGVRMRGVYPGIDLVYHTREGKLEYDFLLAPGADPTAIAIEFDGAREMRVEEGGDLLLRTAGGEVRQRRPLVYQDVDGGRREIPSRHVRLGPRRVGFRVGAYDRRRPLVIDPVLQYATYAGGSAGEVARGIGLDAAGNAYVVGTTASLDFPTTPGAVQTMPAGVRDAFVLKLDPTGRTVLYAAYLGGQTGYRYFNGEQPAASDGMGIAVDAEGHAYVVGSTEATDFPTTPGAFRTRWIGFQDVFVAKLDPSGSHLLYSTYLGSGFGEAVLPGQGGIDTATGIAIDAAGSAYVTGTVGAYNFPVTPGAFVPQGGSSFLTKLDPSGSALVYSTFVDRFTMFGTATSAIAVDADGNACLAGVTYSTTFITTPEAFQRTFTGVPTDGGNPFVMKMNATGTALVYATYLGGPGRANAIAVNGDGEVVVTGNGIVPTTPGAFQSRTVGTVVDAFVAKLDREGKRLLFSTYLGGSGSEGDDGHGLALDALGNVYVTGYTSSEDFPRTGGAVQSTYGGGPSDSFVTKLNPSGTAVVYSGYLGGSDSDAGNGIAVDGSGHVYVTGGTRSADFPVTAGSVQSSYGGGTGEAPPPFLGDATGDAFVARLDLPRLSLTKTASPTVARPGAEVVYTITVTNEGPGPATQVTVTDDLPPGMTAVSCAATGGGACQGGGEHVQVSFPALEVGATEVITLPALLSPSVPDLPVTNEARVLGSEEGSDNRATATTAVSSSCSSYMVGSSTGAAIEPGTDDVGNHTDDGTTPIDLPFPFTLYDRTFTTAFVSSNGALQFGDDRIGAFGSMFAACVPDQRFDYTILAHWDDLRTDAPGGGIFTSVSGVAPHRVFNLEWRTVYFNAPGQTANFEIRLHEDASRFELVYGLDDQDGDLTKVGVQRDASSCFTQFLCESHSGVLRAGLQLAFSTAASPVADLAVTQSATPNPVTAGAELTYTARVVNRGPRAAADVVLTDTLPAETSFLSCSATGGGACEGTGNNRVVRFAAIEAGASVTATLAVTVSPAAPAGGVIRNTVEAHSAALDPNPSNNSATLAVTTPGTDLAVGLAVSPDLIPPGAPVGYVLTVANRGSNTATDVVVSQELPAGTTLLSCTVASGGACDGAGNGVRVAFDTLAAGHTATLLLTVATNPGLPEGTVLSSTARVSSSSLDPDPGNDVATAVVRIATTCSGYSVSRTEGVTIVPGTADTGNHVSSGSFYWGGTTPISLPFPYTLYDRTFTTAVVSSTGVLQFASDHAGTPLEATLPAEGFLYAIFPHWALVKTGSPNAEGDSLGIFTSVTGSAPHRIFNIEWRTVGIPGGDDDTALHANFEVRLYEGQSRFDVVYGRVDGVARQAVVGVQRHPSACFSTALGPTFRAREGTELTFQAAPEESADLVVTRTVTTEEAPLGSRYGSTITVTNRGPGPARDVQVFDLGASVWSCTTSEGGRCFRAFDSGADYTLAQFDLLAPGAVATVDLVESSDLLDAVGVIVQSVAQVIASTPDPDLRNNTASVSVRTVDGRPCNNYSVTVSTGATLQPGVTRVPSNLSHYYIGLPFPYHLYDRLFDPGVFDFLIATPTGTLEFANTAHFDRLNTPLNDLLASQDFLYTIFPHWDDLVLQGAGLGVFVSVTGVAPHRVFNIEWRAAYASDSSRKANFEVQLFEGQQRFDVVYGRVDDGGASATVGAMRRSRTECFTQYAFDTPGSLVPGLRLSFQAQDSANLILDLRTEAAPPFYLPPLPVAPGSTITYRVLVFNNHGPTAARDVVLTTELPSDVTVLSCDGDGGSCAGTGQTRTVTFPSLGFNESRVVRFTTVLRPEAPLGRLLTTTASVAAATPDPDLQLNSVQFAAVVAAPEAYLALTASGAPDSPSPGDTLTYTLDVTNWGASSAAADVILHQTLPAGTTFVSCAATSGGVCAGFGSERSVSFPSLDVGASATVTIVASVNPGLCPGTELRSLVSISSSTPNPNPTREVAVALVVGGTPMGTSCGRYDVSPSDGATIVPGTVDVGNHTDDGTTAIALPFAFTLYEQSFTTAVVSSNGVLQFASDSAAYANSCVAASEFHSAILPHWDDLRTDKPGSGIFTSVSGEAPHRIFNIEWRATYFGSGQPANFEVRLYEGQPRFDVVYGQVEEVGWSATVGVQREENGCSTAFECNAGGLHPGLQLAFTFVPMVADLALTQAASPASVTTGSEVTYTLAVTNLGSGSAGPVVVSDPLSPELGFVSCAATSCGACGGTGNQRQVTFPSLAPGASATATLVARADCALRGGTSLVNAVTVTAPITEVEYGNNSAVALVGVTNPPPLVTCPASVSAVASDGPFATGLQAGTATASDNCPGVAVAGARSDGRALADPYPVGVTTIAWTATDSGGGTASCGAPVAVSYGVCPLYDSTRPVRSGSTIPLKLRLCDTAGANLSAPGTPLTALGLSKLSSETSEALQDCGNANPDDRFRYDPDLRGYIFNLKTSGLARGTYELSFRAGSDPVVHRLEFRVR